MERNPMNFLFNMEKEIAKRRFKFAIKCLHEIIKIDPRENIVFSPYNFYEALFFIYIIATSNIKRYLERALDLSDFQNNTLIRYRFVKTISSDTVISYGNDDESILCCFREDLQSCFALLHPMFRKVPNLHYLKTHHEKIIYFNAALKLSNMRYCRHFVELEEKRDMDFLLINVLRLDVQKLQISTASQSDAPKIPIPNRNPKCKNFLCHELSMLVNEYPYQNGVSLFTLFPISLIYDDSSFRIQINETGLCDLIKRLSTDDGICKLRNLLDNDYMTSENTINFMVSPVFKVEKNLNIYDLLQVLDIEQLLLPDAIDFKYSYKDYKFEYSMRLGNIEHRTNVTVTEENIRAGSFNIICTGQSFPKKEVIEEMNYNYPFVWLIYEKEYRGILFIGANFAERAPFYTIV
ncbi:uncharacterized protein LOC114935883 [Nylanderia fulva]|uniref:uncharacterized protein LOC114935883 n=1 Tax=Nylanderia fulva TaxID=613905 RepID=UPI0010FB364B|nr:uncharacterized protein LOC114935883 [Nylanderia fulva]